MAVISSSDKFDSRQAQYCLSSENFVLLRIIRFQLSYTVMTATAGEDDRSKSAYPNQERLIECATSVFSEFAASTRHASDLHGRPYVEFSGLSQAQIEQGGLSLANALGLELSDLAELWIEFSDAAEEDGLVYLSDGMYLTEDGQLVER
ncbi:hypothetical protein ELH70_14690 [Rhizobium ruizarguesonis]|uniref:hypothetical protein n=1 Tax=Rhizobium ruizarguesonis TaxID=2081791 RepID=UPI001030B839|nr:hypothetical protein [Rhizobium ruizarguesonis]TAZ73814.1 hypothetical protein ELH70_14690 [Rhizobium ruizarguesonis]TBA00415.1 hypothetical protein ELH69_13875 [Rhizobium ruizarguesonis]